MSPMSLLFFLFQACEPAAFFDKPTDPNDSTEIIFEVPKNTSPRGLGPLLQSANVIDSADDFTNFVRLSKQGSCIKAGKFKLNRALSPSKIIETLCGVPLANDKPFTILEGWRIREIDAALAKEGLIVAGAYKKLAEDPSQFTAPFTLPSDTLEGYLYPETYMIDPEKFDPKIFIQRQITLLADTFYTPNKATIDASKRSFQDLVIMASLLEREEPKIANRPLVAGILWKRLDEPCPSKNPCTLGCDASSHYKLADWNDRQGLLKNLRDKDDPYNTRLREGLPPTAIGSPSIESLKAALNPEDNGWWYYLHDKSQQIHPAKSLSGHEQNRKQYNVY